MIVPFVKPEPEEVQEASCSFCQKPKSKVAKLISSSTGYSICNVCVAIATERLKESENLNE